MIFSVSQVINSNSLLPESLSVTTLTKEGYKMQESSVSLAMTTAGPFSAVSIIRSDSAFNAAVSLTLSFQVGPPLFSASDKMTVRLMKSQVVISECQAITATHLTSSLPITLLTEHNDYCDLQITLTFCPCQSASETYALVLSNGLTNPSNNNGQNDLTEVKSMTGSGYMVATGSPKISPVLQGGSLEIVSISPSSSPVSTFSSQDYTFSIKLKTSVNADGQLLLTFPNHLLFLSASSLTVSRSGLSSAVTNSFTSYPVDSF